MAKSKRDKQLVPAVRRKKYTPPQIIITKQN